MTLLNNIGYYISIVLFLLFQVLSIILKFNSSNTWWAFIWIVAIIICSFISTILNIKKGQKSNKLIIAAIILSIMLIAAIAIVIGAILGIPECRFPLY